MEKAKESIFRYAANQYDSKHESQTELGFCRRELGIRNGQTRPEKLFGSREKRWAWATEAQIIDFSKSRNKFWACGLFDQSHLNRSRINIWFVDG